MDKAVLLYDPHPGIGGALVALPEPMKDCIDSMNLKIMTLDEAVNKIKEVAIGFNGEVDVVENYNYIRFSMPNQTNYSAFKNRMHSFRLLRYNFV